MIGRMHQVLPFPDIYLIWLSPGPPSLIMVRPASGQGEQSGLTTVNVLARAFVY